MRSFVSSVVVAVMVGVALGHPAKAAGSAVEITMQDPSTRSDIHAMQMLANPASVRPGAVTFHATNESKTLIHEMLVVKVQSLGEKLPYDRKTSQVIESRVKDLGEISDLKPGTSGSLTLNLKPGDYLLLCNQPGHYQKGMWAKFTVLR